MEEAPHADRLRAEQLIVQRWNENPVCYFDVETKVRSFPTGGALAPVEASRMFIQLIPGPKGTDCARSHMLSPAFAKQAPVREGRIITSSSPPCPPEVQSWKASAEPVLRNRVFILHTDPFPVFTSSTLIFGGKGFERCAFRAGFHFANNGITASFLVYSCITMCIQTKQMRANNEW